MELAKIYAKIDRYVYHNNENSYSILRVITEDDITHTVVGYIPLLSEDVFYEFLGTWIEHDKYGRQLQITSYKKSENQSKEGLISYLSSSLFTGIGPVTAEKIVNHLGNDAIKKILDDKNVLKELGFKQNKIDVLYNQLIENEQNETLLIALYGYNIAGKTAMKILNKYGVLTLSKLEENPYQLINDIEGIGFIKADEIAMKMGLEENDPRRIKAAILNSIYQYTYQVGNIYLTEEQLLKQVNSLLNFDINLDDYLSDLINEAAIIKEENRYYLFSNYQLEFDVSNQIKRINKPLSEPIEADYINTLIEQIQIQKNIEYTIKQKEAIISAITNKVSIITGGPGTGKTTIIDGIIEVYAFYHNINLAKEDIDDAIGLMAPTGRAAKRMEQVLNLPAKTIHRHLGYGYDGMFKFGKTNPMPQKLIIIDESSMIDIFLAEKLFNAIDTNAQVIIVGDVDQLPSVGPGQVLKDLIESKTIGTKVLDEIHRQAKDSNIVTLANKVNMQNLDDSNLNSGNDLFLRKAFNNEIIDIIISQVSGAISQGYDLIDDIQVLIPTYKGEIGIDKVNNIMQDYFNKNKLVSIKYGDQTYYKNDKVIQLVNDPENLVMNGDIGYIKKIGRSKDNKEYAIINFDGNEVIYDKAALENISLAYAMSIHKSQGSEYKIVILPLVRQYMHMLKKELLYTAITRAKNFLIIIGDMKLLVYAANNLAEKRQTTLKLRLNS